MANQDLEMGTLKEDKINETTQALVTSDKILPNMNRIKRFQKNFKETLEWTRLIILSLVGLVIIIVLIYNMFASNEKDVPDAVIEKLYKIMQAGPILGVNGETEWRTMTNLTSN